MTQKIDRHERITKSMLKIPLKEDSMMDLQDKKLYGLG